MDVLTVMPQSVEEIGEANLQYSKLQEQKPKVRITDFFTFLTLLELPELYTVYRNVLLF